MGQSPEKQKLPRASHPGLSQQLGERGGSTIQTAGGGQIRGFPKANSSLVPGSFVLGKWSLRAQGPGQAGASLPRRLGLCYKDQLPLPPLLSAPASSPLPGLGSLPLWCHLCRVYACLRPQSCLCRPPITGSSSLSFYATGYIS